MTTITKVALAGATGNLGPAILQGLLDGGFEVTVLTRQTSSHSKPFPPTVTVKAVDFTSVDSLASALTGIEAVVSTIGLPHLASQLTLIEAAAKVGVKRFIPSEFGSDTYNPLARVVPIIQPKAQSQEKCKELGVPYTSVITGPFLDWGIDVGFIINVKEKKITLWDGGERSWAATTLSSIGKAVAGVLKNLEATKNRAVYTQSASLSCKKLLALAKEVLGDDGWEAPAVPVDQAKKDAEAELGKENPSYMYFVNYITLVIYGEGYGGQPEKVDNELLGIPAVSDEEIRGLIREAASRPAKTPY